MSDTQCNLPLHFQKDLSAAFRLALLLIRTLKSFEIIMIIVREATRYAMGSFLQFNLSMAQRRVILQEEFFSGEGNYEYVRLERELKEDVL